MTSSRVSNGITTTGAQRHQATVVPTVVVRPPKDSKVVKEEAFGALVVVIPFDTLDEVISECNQSNYGLQAGIFTNDVKAIFKVFRELEVGGLIVNGSSNYRLDHVPFGGVKDSGIGRESPRFMIEDYTYIKTMMLRGISLWGDE